MNIEEIKENSAAYRLGYDHGMLAVNELVESLQAKLAQAKAEVERLHEVIAERGSL